MDKGQPVIEEKKQVAVSQYERRAASLSDDALAINIGSDAECKAAEALMNEVIQPLLKEGDALFDPIIKAANDTHKRALEAKKKAIGSLPDAKAHISRELGRWQQVIEARERAEALRREQEARDAEALRIETEIAAVESNSSSWPEDIAAEVRAIIEAPRAALTVPPAPPPMTIRGARTTYKVRVVNERQFYRGIADGTTPTSLAMPNQGALDRRAAADKEGFNIPGCQVEKSVTVPARSVA